MGRKQEWTDALKRNAELMRERNERDAAIERNLMRAMRDMGHGEFTIVTASGYVVKGISTHAAMTAENMGGFPGPRVYTITASIRPINPSKEG